MGKPQKLADIKLLATAVLSSSIRIESDKLDEQLTITFNYTNNVSPIIKKNEHDDSQVILHQIMNARLTGSLSTEKEEEVSEDSIVVDCSISAQMIYTANDCTEKILAEILQEYQWYYEALASFYANNVIRDLLNSTPFSHIPIPISI